jgi:hypothetical protein
MLVKIDAEAKPGQRTALIAMLPVDERKHEDADRQRKAELRRQMYARIAQRNALIEAEDTARRKWRGN